jgi:HAD superfamily hydrolase (TIGR01490 family)
MKKIAVFDLDGTVYTHTLTFDVAEELLKSDIFANERKSIDEAKNIAKERKSTESYWVYNKKVLEVFEKITPLVTPAQMQEAIRNLLLHKGKFCYAYTTSLLTKLKGEGRLMIAISGSIKNIVEPFALALGFDIVVSSELEVVNGVFTGKRASQTNKNKDALLRDVVEKSGATLEDSIGVGDTHRDISMLSVVQNPIAFNPNAALYNEALKNGWKIVIERKNMIYELTKRGDSYILENAHPSREADHQEHLR